MHRWHHKMHRILKEPLPKKIDRGSLMIVANKLLQLTNLDVPEPDPVAMILQSDMTRLKYREIWL
jgi:hypothetical protein